MDCGKRGRAGESSSSATATVKKKAKAAAEVVTVAEEEELWIGVDEGMPWATWWLPLSLWEAAAIGDDDVWDFDIWGLRAAADNNHNITTISPTPSISSTETL